MNKNILTLILALFYSIIFSQVKSDTVDIPELILKENSQLNFTKFNESLKYHELYPTKKTLFNGIYNRKGRGIPFSGNFEDHTKKVSFEKEPENDSIKNILISTIISSIEVRNYYYSLIFSKKNKEVLSKFYCIEKGDNSWLFQAIKEDLKDHIKINQDAKVNFFVKLTPDGRLLYIKSILKNNDNNINKVYNHNFMLSFIPYKNGVKFSKYNIDIINNHNKNSIQINMDFID
ncbi:hypothetical protein I6H88_04200 [Elizabethkingia bruuniana]|uniref:Uncharacterized protein n=1 Tax=Elizabethkingia bruuniana TaxID=1756149 RepID=A0A7T7V0Y3_9FLAO|nr:hypothetical protein [Elizabethkingia bruuniana]AQX86083.1 hypothetical protein AYC65_14210 [Elizabethkingia bruuniana]KUY27739.1 hypothetical protein ATB97_18805 [Elizabethkingia bruuniana]OPB63539.1 hypothetical protein BAY12_09040 [Elizabethkingia bruuniana]QDZ64583.1 hypothetical protein EVD20_21895 [Elizabethkingia bruuniana]QQN59793.1 hypothetical protein I6H88_04200 [Elizabethkingia bruuniana]